MIRRTVIGIDVSTNPQKLGLARLVVEDGRPTDLQLTTGREHDLEIAARERWIWVRR